MCDGFPWHLLNRTELLQLSRGSGDVTAANISHAELVDLMRGVREVTDPPATNSIDQWRDALMRLVLDYWVSIQTQVSCPASELGSHLHVRKGQEKTYPVPKNIACYRCPDNRVLACVKNNVAQLNELLSRKDNKPATYGVSTRSIDMVAAPMQIDLNQIPTEVEKICTLGTFVQIGIARQLGLVHAVGSQPQVPPHGGIDQSIEESAFRATPPETRAQWLVTALQMYKGKKAAPAPAQAVEAPVAPAQQEVAQQPAAPAAAPPTRTRTPRSTAHVATPMTAPQTETAPAVDNSALLKFISEMYTNTAMVNETLNGIKEQLAANERQLQALKEENADLKRYAITAMHICASLGQVTFGAMPEDIISESNQYALNMLGKD